MTVRLPTPGGDNGNWGDILNEFLQIAHNDNGTLRQAALITGAEQIANKSQPGGYASLGNDGLVPLSQLPPAPSGVGDYIGMYANVTLGDNESKQITWDGVTVSQGDSLAWDGDGTPYMVAIVTAGVYAINVTVDWGDTGADGPGLRLIQLETECQFFTYDSRAADPDTGVNTSQSISQTVFLQPGDDIYAFVNQTGSASLSPSVYMIVTRVS